MPNYTSAFSDAENEALTFSATVSPAFSKFSHVGSSTAQFTILNTNNSDVGTYLITVTGTDGHPDTTNASFTVNFTINEDKG